MSSIVRIVTRGREPEAVGWDVAAAISGGSRVLVKVAPVLERFAEKPDGDKGAVADWAEALSQEHGLTWQRVGADVFFTRRGP